MEKQTQGNGQRELSALRDRKAITRIHHENENELLRRQLQEKKTHLAYMTSLSIETLQCKTPWDLQLMAMASWMNHEELMAVEMKRLLIKEYNKPLMISIEPSDPMALISRHNLLANDPQFGPKYLCPSTTPLLLLLFCLPTCLIGVEDSV